jgi:T3SS negative regulator,GrlR
MAYKFEQMEGLWTAEFGSSTGMSGGGVAVFRGGRIFGGDSFYYYAGAYTVSGLNFRATLSVVPFIQGAKSVFGTVGIGLTLELEGSFTEDGHAIAQGNTLEFPNFTFGARLTKQVAGG